MTWHNESEKNVFTELDTNEEGLETEDAEERQSKYGENRIEDEESSSVFEMFISQFQDNLIYLLMAAVCYLF